MSGTSLPYIMCRYSNNYVDHYVWNKLIQCQVYTLIVKVTGVKLG